MMKKRILITTVFVLLGLFSAYPQTTATDSVKFQWFGDAKLGIFIHWGIYSVNGISESWSFYNKQISHQDYMKQLDGFTASGYKPEEWAGLIKESGARYSVITAKHHDGVALWDSKYGKLNVVRKTPAARDLLMPFVKALRDENIKVGIYYSLLDWSNPNYPNFTRTEKRYSHDSLRWDKFVSFNFGQIGEIMDNYNPDLVWFDGDWEQSAEAWHAKEIRELLLSKNKNVIINSRLQGYGDYATPEQGLPIHKPKDKYWELCMTTNTSWGYQSTDTNYKTAYQVISIFSEVIALGGNLLLDIGPKPDGTIPEEQVHILKELGKWTKKHEPAIFGTVSGIPKAYYNGCSTLSKDKRTLYLFVDGKPNGPIMLKGLNNKINSIWVVGSGIPLTHDIKLKAWWSKIPGLVFIDIPENALDGNITVIALALDGEISLFDDNKNKE